MLEEKSHTILLGGVGGDSHSVGLTILRHALQSNGYRVHYLGIQNRLEEFFQLAGMCNAVMISSMDGHSRYYLREFPELMERHRPSGPLWYLGGNLDTGAAVGTEAQFREMGFDRVFAKFKDIRTVLELLARDLHDVTPMPPCPTLWESVACGGTSAAVAAVSDERVRPSQFERSRQEALVGWKTGSRARVLEENAEFLVRQPSFPKVQALVHAGELPMLVQPRSGVPLLDEQIRLFQMFKSVNVRVLSYQVDSLTRNNNYKGAEEAIRESAATGSATMNGFPVINHGVNGLRRVISEVRVPLQTRHSTRDPRLLAEISYAGGVTAFEGGAICYNIPYYKDYPLAESIRVWQYVDRLTGLYHERFGITLDREFFGTLTATLIPPCLAVVVNIIEAILAVRQGVKCVSLGYAEQGNRVQDVAAVRALGEMGREFIDNLGHPDVQVNTVFHQYMAAFPDDSTRASSIIYNSAVTAALSGATRVIVKTPVEAYRIPSADDNLDGIGLVQRGVSAGCEAGGVREWDVQEECAVIRREAEAILESVFQCGRGSLAEGVVAAFRKGYVDIPFAPSNYNRGEVMTARDADGAVRFLSFGSLQLDAESREFHRERMSERRRAEGLRADGQDYLLVENDVMRVARGQFERWPLYG